MIFKDLRYIRFCPARYANENQELQIILHKYVNCLRLTLKRAPYEHKMTNEQFYISNSARIIVATCCRLGAAHHTHEAHTPSLSSREVQLMDDLLPHKRSAVCFPPVSGVSCWPVKIRCTTDYPIAGSSHLFTTASTSCALAIVQVHIAGTGWFGAR